VRLTLDRTDYGDNSTLGKLYVDGQFQCVTLEDEIEVNGQKRDGQTCIPDGLYQIVITWSPKFKRSLPLILNVPNFDGIRIHPGNDAGDTRGCILVGQNVTLIQDAPFLLHSAAAFQELYPKLLAALQRGETLDLEVMA